MAGFASHGQAAYTWWHTFLHEFVVPNAGWIGVDGLVANLRQRYHGRQMLPRGHTTGALTGHHAAA